MDEPIVDRWLQLSDLPHKKVSYAQNQEDILLERALPGPDGFFLDVGANDPIFHSVTKRFSEKGWRGIHVEPNPALCRRLREDRPRDLTLNVGVSDAPGTLTFHEVPEYHGWSTFHPEAAASYHAQGVATVERQVPVMTLAEICERHVDRPIDFLKIDVEGFERQAIDGADWRRFRPRIVVVEATWPESWEHLLLAQDYEPAAFDGLNRFYVRAEDRDLKPALAAPVNVLDGFIAHDQLRLIEGLHAELTRSRALAEELGPRVVQLARGLRRLALRHPRLSAVARRFVRSRRRF